MVELREWKADTMDMRTINLHNTICRCDVRKWNTVVTANTLTPTHTLLLTFDHAAYVPSAPSITSFNSFCTYC
jgi:hypothetical protein